MLKINLNVESLSALSVAACVLVVTIVLLGQLGFPDFYIAPLSTLAAAFLGAWSAFLLHDKREEAKDFERKADAANRSLFFIGAMANEIARIYKRNILPFKDDELRILSIRPIPVADYDEIHFDSKNLSFVLDSHNPGLLGDLLSLESFFHQMIARIKERSAIHREDVQPVIESNNWPEGSNLSLNQVEIALGVRIYKTLERSTEHVINNYDTFFAFAEKVYRDFLSVLKEELPNRNFISINLEQIKTQDNKANKDRSAK